MGVSLYEIPLRPDGRWHSLYPPELPETACEVRLVPLDYPGADFPEISTGDSGLVATWRLPVAGAPIPATAIGTAYQEWRQPHTPGDFFVRRPPGASSGGMGSVKLTILCFWS